MTPYSFLLFSPGALGRRYLLLIRTANYGTQDNV